MTKRKRRRFNVELGFRLMQMRNFSQVTQETLGEQLSVSTSTMQRYETGEIPITAEALHICARQFDTPVGFFFGEGEEMPRPSNTNKTGLLIAADIMALPNDNVRKSVYQLVRAINRAHEEKEKSTKAA